LRQQERSVDENIDVREQLLLLRGAVQQGLEGVAGIGGDLVALPLQKFRQAGKGGGLGERLAAGEGHAPAQGIGLGDGHEGLLLHGRAAAKGPGLGIVAAGTVVGTALAEDAQADAGAVHDAVTDDSAEVKHSDSVRA